MPEPSTPHCELLVEERSAKHALDHLLPRLLGGTATFRIHPFRGKLDLLRKLPQRLAGYARLPVDFRVVVLIDADNEDCRALKRKLDTTADRAGLAPRTRVLNRLAIEELEAWFFGDIEALRAAYPRLPSTLAARRRYRRPDAIVGGTWEALERELQRAGYYRNGMPKTVVADRVGRHLHPDRNRSPSFRAFCSGLRRLVAGPGDQPTTPSRSTR